MALVQAALIWVVYAVALGLVLVIASTFVFVYQGGRERNIGISIVSIVSLGAALATLLLLPVDLALIASTTSSRLGRRKEWATPDRVNDIVYELRIVAYCLYALDAFCILLLLPFTYFYHEQYDEVDAEEGRQTVVQRLLGALKYTLAFVVLAIALFLVGFFIPLSTKRTGDHYDFQYFRHLLAENRGFYPATVLDLLIDDRW